MSALLENKIYLMDFVANLILLSILVNDVTHDAVEFWSRSPDGAANGAIRVVSRTPELRLPIGSIRAMDYTVA